MIAAATPSERSVRAKLLIVRRDGRMEHRSRSALPDLLRPGDLVVANDAATLPASLLGIHLATARAIEVRLAGRRSLDPAQVSDFLAVVFGAGDFRTRTEDRPQPPALASGDRLALGPLSATVARVLGHPRLVLLHFDGSSSRIWEGFARHGRPIQYSHVPDPLALWDVWTALAGPPVRAKGWPRRRSAQAVDCASSMCCFRGRTRPVRAITSCCELLSTTRRCGAWTSNWRAAAIERTSSATRSLWSVTC
jgi:S-adenosylmethionine:tRNA ribosyltransferase-isomerase